MRHPLNILLYESLAGGLSNFSALVATEHRYEYPQVQVQSHIVGGIGILTTKFDGDPCKSLNQYYIQSVNVVAPNLVLGCWLCVSAKEHTGR